MGGGEGDWAAKKYFPPSPCALPLLLAPCLLILTRPPCPIATSLGFGGSFYLIKNKRSEALATAGAGVSFIIENVDKNSIELCYSGGVCGARAILMVLFMLCGLATIYLTHYLAPTNIHGVPTDEVFPAYCVCGYIIWRLNGWAVLAADVTLATETRDASSLLSRADSSFLFCACFTPVFLFPPPHPATFPVPWPPLLPQHQ